MRKIMILSLLSPLALVACHNQSNPPPDNSASLCSILKQKVQAENYQTTDPNTMQRKNVTDQARLVKEYDSYGCPEIIDSAPLP